MSDSVFWRSRRGDRDGGKKRGHCRGLSAQFLRVGRRW